jgi:hypothetical protein
MQQGRHPLDVPVRLLRGKRESTASLRDVNSRGLLVTTGEPPPLRQLVKIELSMPTDGSIFASHATVVRVAKEEGGSGENLVGLELFGQDRRGLDAWEALVRFAESASVGAREPVSERAITEERRKRPRFAARLEMRVRSTRNIHVAFTRDLSQSGLFMEGGPDLAIELGEQLVFNIVRPESRASVRVTGQARHKRAIGSGMGYGIAFDPMPAELEQEMLAFVTGAVEFLEQQARGASMAPGRPPTGG